MRNTNAREMLEGFSLKRVLSCIALCLIIMAPLSAQTSQRSSQPGSVGVRQQAPSPVPTHADILRGQYGRYRANNDLLSYHLDIRVDPEKKFVSGKNTICFRMLKDDNRIQLDLYDNLKVDKILFGGQGPRGRGEGQSAKGQGRDPSTSEPISKTQSQRPKSQDQRPKTLLKYERDSGAVFVDFPETLKAGSVETIDFYYSGTPQTIGRFGGFSFSKDPAGRPWIFTACEGEGASIWWPNKDQWKDEPESMKISVQIPKDLVDVSNGKFLGKTDLGDGYTRWDWLVQYPINNYNVSVNIGKYEHWSDRLGDLPLDFYALPEDLDKAKKQFAQAKGMLTAYQHYFGEYPFKKDGYKLIQAPYTGMEHQSAVTYGNRFTNGYYGRDWTGVGISPRFDFIIIHESGHEWFGNSVSAADTSDMWIHEGWTTYLESLYVEYMYGHDDAIKYLNGYKSKVRNRQPIIGPRGVNYSPSSEDQYFKGALFLNTLRSVINDDKRWWALLRNFYQHFKYQNIMTEDVVAYFNKQTGRDLTPIFDQYLRHTAVPALELKFDEAKGTVAYRWKVDEPKFTMPVRVGTKNRWQIIRPTTQWQTMKTTLKKDDFAVATELYFVEVSKS